MELDLDDSSELLYSTLASNQDIEQELLDQHLRQVLQNEVRTLYNNQEQFIQQLQQAQQQQQMMQQGQMPEEVPQEEDEEPEFESPDEHEEEIDNGNN